MSSDSARPDPGTTRARILECAADLFAARGYHGTSTREIARRVGIRQPSLFHHFASKRHILAELLERDLVPALQRIRTIRTGDGSPAARLHAYVAADIAALIALPFDARGLYDEDVLEDPGLRPQRETQEAFHEEIRALIGEGITDGALRPVDPEFGRQVIHAMTVEIIYQVAARPRAGLDGRPAEIADFVLRGLLGDPAALEAVRSEAAELVSG